MAKGGAKTARGKRAKAPTTRRQCPACGTEAAYPPGDVPCKVCGTIVPQSPAQALPTLEPAPPVVPFIVRAAPAQEGPTALAVVALVCGILAVMTVWVLPLCLLLGGIAIVTGIVAITNAPEPGTNIMAAFGIALGALAILVMWWMFAYIDDGGSSATVSSGDDDYDDGGSGGGGGGGGGGSGGSSGEGGGSGDSGDSGDTGGGSGDTGDAGDSGGSGGDSGGGGDTGGTDAPAPVAMLVGLSLLAAAAWRRRA